MPSNTSFPEAEPATTWLAKHFFSLPAPWHSVDYEANTLGFAKLGPTEVSPATAIKMAAILFESFNREFFLRTLIHLLPAIPSFQEAERYLVHRRYQR
jgi:hypothetical protein